MKCAIMQPTFIPWLGYLDLIDQVDHFIFLNDVKLEKSSWQVRNRIKSIHGELYLTIPIWKTKSRLEMLILEAEINQQENWKSKHSKTIKQAYQKTPFFGEVFPFVEQMLETESNLLGEFNTQIIKAICERIGISTAFHSSALMQTKEGVKDARLISLCLELNCTDYISPPGSSVYINKEVLGGQFVDSRVSLFYMDYAHPSYHQLYGDFLPYMSVVDLLFNVGFEKALETIRSGRKPPMDYRTLHDKMQRADKG